MTDRAADYLERVKSNIADQRGHEDPAACIAYSDADAMIAEIEELRAAMMANRALSEAIAADENLSSLRARLNQVDGNEAHRILPEIWPSIKAICALSDVAEMLSRGETEGKS
jgi:hypothetical protein